MKAPNLRKAAGTIQQHMHMHVDRLCLVQAGILIFSTTQCLCLFITLNFLLEPKGRGGRRLGLFYCLILSDIEYCMCCILPVGQSVNE